MGNFHSIFPPDVLENSNIFEPDAEEKIIESADAVKIASVNTTSTTTKTWQTLAPNGSVLCTQTDTYTEYTYDPIHGLLDSEEFTDIMYEMKKLGCTIDITVRDALSAHISIVLPLDNEKYVNTAWEISIEYDVGEQEETNAILRALEKILNRAKILKKAEESE